MSQWVRLFNHISGASAEWHIPRTKSFTTTTYCDADLSGPLEVASDDKAEREGRCASCVTHLATTQGVVAQRPSQPMTQARLTPVEIAAAKKSTAKKPVGKSAPKGRSGKARVAKRPVRRPRRGKA